MRMLRAHVLSRNIDVYNNIFIYYEQTAAAEHSLKLTSNEARSINRFSEYEWFPRRDVVNIVIITKKKKKNTEVPGTVFSLLENHITYRNYSAKNH